MADERKPKIDLKSRLGRKTVSSPSGPSIPPPVGVSRSSIPVPPFAAQPSARKVDVNDPYSAVQASVAPPQPQAIRVEMGEEVIQAQKKARGKMIAAAAVTALVGGIIGFAVGGGSERSKTAEVAIQGARDLAQEIDKANAVAEEIAEVLKSAQSKLAKGEFPEAEVSKLGGLRIPFEGINLTGKGIGRFKGQLVSALIDYTAAVETANDQKEKVQRILSGSKKAIEEMLSQKDDPTVRWSVYVTQGPYGPWANMQPLPKPFPVKKKGDDKYKWPDEFEIKEGNQTHKLSLYQRGTPTGESALIPVAPTTHDLVCPSDTLFKLARELRELQTSIRGESSQMPDEESAGVLKSGQVIIEMLKGIGQGG